MKNFGLRMICLFLGLSVSCIACWNKQLHDVPLKMPQPVDTVNRLYLQLYGHATIPNYYNPPLALEVLAVGNMQERYKQSAVNIYNGGQVKYSCHASVDGDHIITSIGELPLIDSVNSHVLYESDLSVVLNMNPKLVGQHVFGIRSMATGELKRTIAIGLGCTIEIARNLREQYRNKFTKPDIIDQYAKALESNRISSSRFLLREVPVIRAFSEEWKK